MSILKRTLFIILCMIFSMKVSAQDFHFSQYFASPIFLNPAFTGVVEGDMRIAANYRNQWFNISNFTTYALSVDGNIGRHKMNENYLGVGGAFFTDIEEKSGFRNTSASLSMAYNLKVGSGYAHQYIGAGFTAAFLKKQINLNNAVFGRLYEVGENFDPVQLLDATKMKFDFSTGISYFMNYRDKHYLSFGAALFHINRPSYGLIGDDRLYMRFNTYVSAETNVARDFSIIPTFMFQKQGPSTEFNLGLFGKVFIANEKYDLYDITLSLGAMYRLVGNEASIFNSDALIAAMRFEVYKIIFGFSYDITLSKLGGFNNRNGGPEISLVTNLRFKDKRKYLHMPRF